jgi:anti-sigma regulatory factor (Ser/Thr protein kinase)
MPTVRLAFSSVPKYVRTARLVGVAVARRAGVPDDLLDEVRLAIGEACGRAVARHRQHGITELVRVELSDDGPYVVRVIDACGAGRTVAAGRDRLDEDEEADADRMHETLLAATVHDLQVRRDASGTVVRMAWPVRRRLSGTGR